MNKLVLILLAIFLAPVAVFMKYGAGKDLLINILLCFLAYGQRRFMPYILLPVIS